LIYSSPKTIIIKEEHMKLLTVDLKKKFARTGSQQGAEDPEIIAKYFLSGCNWTFYATEFDPSTNVFTGIFRYLETEWGTIGLHHLETLIGPFGVKVERDKFFKSVRVSEIPCLKITAGW
jgi:hypothetical protein